MTDQPEKSSQTTLAAMRPQQEKVENMPAVILGLGTLQGFELLQRAAKMISTSTLIPKEYVGNMSNCAVALEMSIRIGCGYLQVMQNLDVVHGRPAWRAKFLISTVNTCGRFTAIRFEFFGEQGKDTWGCRAWAIEKSTGEKLIGPDISLQLAKDEGWYGKSGSKWKTIPQKMLMYRAGAWWSDLYAPELAMGLKTREEEQDVWDAERLEDGSYAVNMDDLRAQGGSAETLDTVIDPITGEIHDEVANQNTIAAASTVGDTPPFLRQPRLIPVKSSAADSTKSDWDAYAGEWQKTVALMTDAQSLEKLRTLNQKNLDSMQRENPSKYTFCIEEFTARIVAMGGVDSEAA